MKKIEVDQNKCIGCGACVSLTNSEIFDFNDDGLASAIENNFDELNEEKKEEAKDAIEGCPTDAIKIEKVEEVEEV